MKLARNSQSRKKPSDFSRRNPSFKRNSKISKRLSGSSRRNMKRKSRRRKKEYKLDI